MLDTRTADVISNLLPHREPFLFIDEVVSIDLGKKIHCIKNNSPDEDYFSALSWKPHYARSYFIRNYGSSFRYFGF